LLHRQKLKNGTVKQDDTAKLYIVNTGYKKHYAEEMATRNGDNKLIEYEIK